jgi:hypothetical protein
MKYFDYALAAILFPVCLFLVVWAIDIALVGY